MRQTFRSPASAVAACGVIVALLLMQASSQGATTSSPKPTPKTTASAKPSLQPRAIDILKASSARLAGARTLSFTAVELFENSSRQGHPLAYASKYQVTLQRPDKLKVVLLADAPASDFYYNGTTMTAFSSKEHLVATGPAPSTIDATLKAAYKAADIYFPFTDVIVANPYKDMAGSLQRAYYIGQSNVVGDTLTDIVAIVGNGVFEQLWIGADDKLPRMIRAVFLNDPERLRHHLVFSDWRVDPELPADTFTFTAPADAKPMKFGHPEAPAPVRPRPTSQATKSP